MRRKTTNEVRSYAIEIAEEVRSYIMQELEEDPATLYRALEGNTDALDEIRGKLHEIIDAVV